MPNSIWDTATHIVFERGVTFRKAHNRWLCSTATQAVCNFTPLDFAEKTDFRAVYVETPHPARPLTYIIPQKDTRMLDMRVQDVIYQRKWDRSHYNRHLQIYNIEYCLGLLLYDCKQLASNYSLALEFITAFPPPSSEQYTVSRQFELYYAFDSAVTAAIRTLDSFRPLLWHGFGESGQVPSNFKRTVGAATKLPDDVRNLIDEMTAIVDAAKEHRDCIQHYFSPGVHTDFADIQKLGIGFWTLTAWLPDNVQTRSAQKFTYDNKTDALSFTWELVNSIVRLFETLAAHIAEADPPNRAP